MVLNPPLNYILHNYRKVNCIIPLIISEYHHKKLYYILTNNELTITSRMCETPIKNKRCFTITRMSTHDIIILY